MIFWPLVALIHTHLLARLMILHTSLNLVLICSDFPPQHTAKMQKKFIYSIDNASYHFDSLLWCVVFVECRGLLPELMDLYDVAVKLHSNYDVTFMAPIFTN